MKNRIATLAKTLAIEHGTNNPFDIADALGISVYFVDLGEPLGYYAPVINKRCILLNQNLQDSKLLNFVCAHELLHAIEHHEAHAYYTATFAGTRKHEQDANIFATALCLYGVAVEEYTTIEDMLSAHGVPLNMSKYV